MLQKAWGMSNRQRKTMKKKKSKVRKNGRDVPVLETFLRDKMKETIGDPEKYLNENAISDLFRDTLLKSKNAPYGRSKLMVIGEAGSGKSSLCKVLMSQAFDPKEPPSQRISVRKVDGNKWEETTHQNFLAQLSGVVQRKEKATSPALMQMLHRTATDLSFMLWDFASNNVLDSMYHLFLTDYGCYLLVFNIARLLHNNSRQTCIKNMSNWLFCKKVYAPKSPIILVGTECEGYSEQDLEEVEKILAREVFEDNAFHEIQEAGFSFIPVDSATGTNINLLRKTIVTAVRDQKYIYAEVPVAFMKIMELMADMGKDYLRLVDVEEMALACGVPGEQIHLGLKFLSYRGLITYLHQHNLLRRIIVLRPQWLIDGLRSIIFDVSVARPNFDPVFARDYRRFERDRIIAHELVENIWAKQGYERVVRHFFLRVLLMTSLVGEYNFDNTHGYLVPAFSKSKTINHEARIADYEGPFFIIDFSGNCDPKIVRDRGQKYVRYRPFGFFEKLVSLCVEHSARFPNSMQPIVDYGSAMLSFGVEIDFLLQQCDSDRGRPLWIKVSCLNGTSMQSAQALLKRIYSMIEGLRLDFFSSKSKKQLTQLAVNVLLPSSAESGEILADYRWLRRSFASQRKVGGSSIIRPCPLRNQTVDIREYAHWYGTQENLDVRKSLHEMNFTPEAVELKTLPSGLEYHCFLSYKQKSAIDIVGKQFLILKNKGYKCWYDQEFQGTINLANMKEGVRKSMCYILFLSEDIFPSPYVEAELETALEFKKPILLLHHPDTGKVGYPSFDVYIKTAPEILKPLFAEIESIQLQRRYYLQEAVTKLLDARLAQIYSALMS